MSYSQAVKNLVKKYPNYSIFLAEYDIGNNNFKNINNALNLYNVNNVRCYCFTYTAVNDDNGELIRGQFNTYDVLNVLRGNLSKYIQIINNSGVSTNTGKLYISFILAVSTLNSLMIKYESIGKAYQKKDSCFSFIYYVWKTVPYPLPLNLKFSDVFSPGLPINMCGFDIVTLNQNIRNIGVVAVKAI